jgi:hypothetical protein
MYFSLLVDYVVEKFPSFYVIQAFKNVFHASDTGYYPRPDESTPKPPYLISLKLNLTVMPEGLEVVEVGILE